MWTCLTVSVHGNVLFSKFKFYKSNDINYCSKQEHVTLYYRNFPQFSDRVKVEKKITRKSHNQLCRPEPQKVGTIAQGISYGTQTHPMYTNERPARQTYKTVTVLNVILGQLCGHE